MNRVDSFWIYFRTLFAFDVNVWNGSSIFRRRTLRHGTVSRKRKKNLTEPNLTNLT